MKLISEELDNLVGRESLEIQRDQLLNSFRYPAMNDRDNDISDAHEHTYNWVFDLSDFPSKHCADHYTSCRDRSGSWSRFLNWLKSGSQFFWVSGKAGSEKSTLMKAIPSHSETIRILEIAGPDVLMMRHYFWKAGSRMQSAYKSLLCSLTYQFYQHKADALDYRLEHDWTTLKYTFAGSDCSV